MNMGNDWKNIRRCILTGKMWGMEQSIPTAISSEIRSPEIQHFTCTTVEGSSGPPLGKALKATFAAPQRPGGGARTRPNGPTGAARPAGPASGSRSAKSGAAPTGRTRASPSAGAPAQERRRRGPGSAWGRERREETSFSGLTAEGSFAAASQSFIFCTCLCVHPSLPGRSF